MSFFVYFVLFLLFALLLVGQVRGTLGPALVELGR